MTLRIDDVERPDGSHTAHEVIRGPDAAGIVVLSPDRGLLMIWRHRFMPNTWGWEIPGGAIEPNEEPEGAARRECLEETGWRVVGPTTHLSTHHPSVGLVNQTFHVYQASAAEYVGEPTDSNEAAEVDWMPLERIAAALCSGEITDAFTQLGVTLALARSGYGYLLAEFVAPIST